MIDGSKIGISNYLIEFYARINLKQITLDVGKLDENNIAWYLSIN